MLYKPHSKFKNYNIQVLRKRKQLTAEVSYGYYDSFDYFDCCCF